MMTARERLEELDDALDELAPYIEHAQNCAKAPVRRNGVDYGDALTPHPCTCGLDEVLMRIDKVRA